MAVIVRGNTKIGGNTIIGNPQNGVINFVTTNLIGWYDASYQTIGDTFFTDQSYVNNLSLIDHKLIGSNGAAISSVGGVKALYTDGINDGAGYPGNANPLDPYYVPNLTSYTEELWFRSNGGYLSLGQLFNAGFNTGSRARFSTAARLIVILTATSYSPTTFFNIDTWHHLVITVQQGTPQDTLKIYRNGTEIFTSNVSYNPTYAFSHYSLGIYGSNVEWGRFFYGIVRRYNRALSLSEITQNYNAEKSRFGY